MLPFFYGASHWPSEKTGHFPREKMPLGFQPCSHSLCARAPHRLGALQYRAPFSSREQPYPLSQKKLFMMKSVCMFKAIEVKSGEFADSQTGKKTNRSV